MNYQVFSAKTLAIASILGLGLAMPAFADAHVAGEMDPEAVEMEAGETISQTETLVPIANIAEIVNSVDDFSTLAAALEAAELTEALMGDGPFTVFAPPNEAFEALPDGVVEALLMPENLDLLTDILTYHVIPGEVMSGDLVTGPVETLEGSDLPVVIDEDMVTVGDVSVVAVDVPATNGVIHIIDGVLVPDDVVAELETRLAAAEEEVMVEEDMTVEEEAVVIEEETVVEETVVEEEVVVEQETVEQETAEPVRGLW